MVRHPTHLVARGIGRLSRALGRGGGTSLPGAALLRMRPNAIRDLAGRLEHGCVLVTGTNGKTTSARMLSACLEEGGLRVAGNRAGANLTSGVATALLAAESTRPAPDVGVFEVDEFALPAIARLIRPRVVLLLNLARDQLDRYGELETIAERWAELLHDLPGTVLAVNVDDPLLADLALSRPESRTFGIEDVRHARAALPDAADSTRCRHCGATLVYDAVLVGHQGHWRCEGCGRARPTPAVRVTEVGIEGPEGSRVGIDAAEGRIDAELAVPGLHNVSNAAGVAAAALAIGIAPDAIARGLARVRPAFGRAERVRIAGRDVMILLAKNPAGTNENIRTCLLDPRPLHVLMALEDRIADGRDVSWIWDVDLDDLLPRLDTLTLAGSRAHDLALRFRYAGVDMERMRVVTDVAEALDDAVAAAPADGSLYVLPTYTAMLDLRGTLEARGVTGAFWRDGAAA